MSHAQGCVCVLSESALAETEWLQTDLDCYAIGGADGVAATTSCRNVPYPAERKQIVTVVHSNNKQ